ncbi:MAG: response regulator transcription factor, partial [Bacteroidota bacterium]
VLGLETGADDYLTKPFSVREFMARVKSTMRRREMDLSEAGDVHPKKKLIVFDDLEIDEEKRLVRLNNDRVELTPKEFDLLLLLASNPGRSYSRDKLLNLVWGYEYKGYEHNVNSHINRLRTKIEPDLSAPKYILTTWGVGYRFADL